MSGAGPDFLFFFLSGLALLMGCSRSSSTFNRCFHERPEHSRLPARSLEFGSVWHVARTISQSWIIRWIDVIDSSRTDELKKNALLISGPGVVSVLCRTRPPLSSGHPPELRREVARWYGLDSRGKGVRPFSGEAAQWYRKAGG